MVRKGSGTSDCASLSQDKTRSLARFHMAFQRLAGQPLPQDDAFSSLIRVRPVAEGDVVFSAGSVDQRVHVVLGGFLVLKYESADGASWVKGFVPPDIPFACVSCLDDLPAPFHAHVGAACEIASVPYQALDRLADESMGWQRAIRNAFKLYGQRKEKREMELLMLTAEQRYLAFLEEFPDVARRLKQHEIASYIRVTPVSLSRIRRRLHLTDARTPDRTGRAANGGAMAPKQRHPSQTG